MRILVTGGSGFVGRNVVEHFGKRHEVLAPTHKELDLLDEDKVGDFFRQNEIDAVIHTAIKPGNRNTKEASNRFYSNVRMFFNIMHNSDRFGKMILTSSGAIYDMRYPIIEASEDFAGERVPADDLGFSKYIISKHIDHMPNVTELRIFGVFGKHEDYEIRFISNAICRALLGLPIAIKQNRVFSYVYISDLMKVMEHFIKKDGEYKSYNVTDGLHMELLAIAKKVSEITGMNAGINIKYEGMGIEYSGNNSRLVKETGIGFMKIGDAIKDLVQWYEENIGRIDRNLLLMDEKNRWEQI